MGKGQSAEKYNLAKRQRPQTERLACRPGSFGHAAAAAPLQAGGNARAFPARMEGLCGLRMVQGAETRRSNLQEAFSFPAQNRSSVVVADQRRTQQELMRSQDGLHCEANCPLCRARHKGYFL